VRMDAAELAARLRQSVQGCTTHIHGPVQAWVAIEDAVARGEVTRAEVAASAIASSTHRLEEMRASGVPAGEVGQLVAPALRARWTLVLGNSTERLEEILRTASPVGLFFYDNGPDVDRARFELRKAWGALAPSAVLLAHHTDANSAWGEFCQWQGVAPQMLDAGPPPMGALSVRSARSRPLPG